MAENEVTAAAPVAAAVPASSAPSEQVRLTSAQLDELLSPIALYPDPLIAIVLPASTFPTDVVMAARYLKAGGDPEAVESQPWDDSVKALARYPEVVKWMDENLAWTRQLGEVFALQPADVLTSTQRLRTAARAAGNLTNTPQQTVVVEREVRTGRRRGDGSFRAERVRNGLAVRACQAEDPFAQQGLAHYDIIEFKATRLAPGLNLPEPSLDG